MFTYIANIFKKPELRSRIIFTLGMLFVYRIGVAITIPGVNGDVLTRGFASTGIFGIMNLLGGGSLERFSLFSLGVSPYITASIIIELLSMDVIPTLTEWSKEGENGRKKKDKVTRYITVVLAAVQGLSLTYAFDHAYGLLIHSNLATYAYVGVVMVAGAMLSMWMGDQITSKGVGNGISLLIFTGIVANLPASFIATAREMIQVTGADFATTAGGVFNYLLFVIIYLLIIVFVVYNEGAVRKIPINYASSSNPMMRTKDKTHMPIKINSAGVIPVIFASSVMSTPLTIMSFMSETSVTSTLKKIFDFSSQPGAFVIYLILIVLFTFFYANLQIDAEKIAGDLKKSSGSIPGVRQGKETENYIKKVLNRITVLGAIFLVIIAAIPIALPVIWPVAESVSNQIRLGGTGLIIVAGVALETVKQINTYMTRREYKGYIRK